MVTQKTIKQQSNKTGLLFAELIVNPLVKADLDLWVNLNLISKNVETEVVVIVWTLVGLKKENGGRDDVRLQALLSASKWYKTELTRYFCYTNVTLGVTG